MLAEIESDFNPEVLQEALSAHGLSSEPAPQDLDGFESYVFACQKPDKPVDLILKLYHQSHRSQKQIEAELNWVDFLATKGLAVPKVLKSPQGKRIEVIQNNFFAVISQRFKGKSMTKKCFRPEHCNDLGSLYGRLHLASYEYGLKNTVVQRPHWQESPSLQFEANLPIDQETETSICTQLFHSIQNFTKTAKTYGLVHGDLHDGNFLLSQTPKTKVAKNNPQERIQIFDFDDCEYHWFANDIAVGLYYLMHRFSDPLQPELKTNFALDYLQRVFKHYQKFFDLPSDILEHIPIFLRLRDALLYSLVHKVYSKETMGSDDLAGLERRRQRILNKDPGCNWHKIQSALKV